MSDDSPPEILYKYRPIDDNTLSCLTRNVLWFANPETFNDPFDGHLQLPIRGELEAVTAYMGANLVAGNPFGDVTIGDAIARRLHDEGTAAAVLSIRPSAFAAQAEIALKLRRRGVFSGSETPTNILMWSHYADRHRGICIGYRMCYKDMSDAYVRRVKYSDNDDREVLDPVELTDPDRAIEKLLTFKSHLWKYEKEWRLILKDKLSDSEKGRERPLVGEVAEIIFGLRTPARDVTIVRRIAGAKSHKLAINAYSKYKLEIRNLST